ncbi:MAG: TlpA family protein disulfide reductase [Cocleimonas sp.]|nr:TlpA family protein disulfide reductase [Cocleimonas sp.]
MLKKTLLIFSSLFLIFGTFHLYAERPLLKKLSGKSTAPDFELIDLKDKIHSLKDYSGKPLVVNFWATWCPPCRKEIPSMNRAWKKLKSEGINMIAINVGEEDSDVYSFMDKYPIDFQVLLDPKSESLVAWNLTGLPTTYVIAPNGAVIYRATGGRAWDNEKIINKIIALKNKKPTEKKKVEEKKIENELLTKAFYEFVK